MNRAQCLEFLHPVVLQLKTPEVIDAFVAEMRTKFYGPQETKQAFFFFCRGYDAGLTAARRNLSYSRNKLEYGE